MIQLTADECRVLGVLIEKELTTPEQYPLTLNATVNGANQKNNREPVVSFDEDRVFAALESLREKGLVLRVDAASSRVPKFRHETTTKLGVNRYELVILAELMLRGPQTLGELRGRASRMHHLDSLEIVKQSLTAMAAREDALVKEIPPSPGSRAERWAQLLCPEAHPIDALFDAPAASAPAAGHSNAQRIEMLEKRVSLLREAVRKLASAMGEADPTADWEAKQ